MATDPTGRTAADVRLGGQVIGYVIDRARGDVTVKPGTRVHYRAYLSFGTYCMVESGRTPYGAVLNALHGAGLAADFER